MCSTASSARLVAGAAVAILAVVAGCRTSADAQPQPNPEPRHPSPAERFERDMLLRYHMHASFDSVRGIERLLVRGKLDDARDFARGLSTESGVPGLTPWAKQVALVRDRAAAVASATGVDDAIRREAQLAQACAQCHADTSAQVEFLPPPTLPADEDAVAARMMRHRWAADRIWEGMIGDSDEAWNAGFDVLAARPLAWNTFDADRVNMAKRLQQLAAEARRAPASNLGERARLYGEVLVTCAACHVRSPPK